MSRPRRGLNPLLAAALVFAAGASLPVSAREIDSIAEVLHLEPGMKIADIGAGDGDWSIALSQHVGPSGHVFATEIEPAEIKRIREKIERGGHSNISVLMGDQEDTGLSADCCDAVLLRMVYHHFADPPAMLTSIRKALRPAGLLAVIDITPQQHWRALEGVPDRGGHGISLDDLIEEITSGGFELVGRYDNWNGDSDRFCVVFRRASQQPL